MSEDEIMSVEDIDVKVTRIDGNVEQLIIALDDIIKQRQHINNLYDHWRSTDSTVVDHGQRIDSLEQSSTKTKQHIRLIHLMTVSVVVIAVVGLATHILI